jgi:hypothetical protein
LAREFKLKRNVVPLICHGGAARKELDQPALWNVVLRLSHQLPVRRQRKYKSEIQFLGYRKYQADATIRFNDGH